jgi:hypothetical protein
MIALFSHSPFRLIAAAITAATLVVLLAARLGWHALRRMFGVPRVPRERATYLLLTVLWGGAAAACGVVLLMAFVLRDHQPVDDGHALVGLRCQASAPGHLRLELTVQPSLAPERYDLEGDACVVSVAEVELRPGLRILGLRQLARVDSVGSHLRPRANADWLTPRPDTGGRLLNLVVRRTEYVPVAVPADAQQRYLVVAPPIGPALTSAHI